ncbi:uncharacterized protein LACBIDRAFT_321574 [Laccaria bicolor S238N-H82]|uniref:Predicted protein n=1 Tax=Laccaria bicolor (strain S238N-H82 / ATCC MYA-4686) TaxID=486041 RepID=B0CTE2_LACBS|nr:uncharacterized protein LACBIDRAFT_321574 [Laccaria bicolor S238N-H82]EDR13903.1 predicted protein [Laccaria bicolor S238N-H82]|eukprot:XP_001874462.1 predicted protein [Laccaria bicolor S238N-H82]
MDELQRNIFLELKRAKNIVPFYIEVCLGETNAHCARGTLLGLGEKDRAIHFGHVPTFRFPSRPAPAHFFILFLRLGVHEVQMTTISTICYIIYQLQKAPHCASCEGIAFAVIGLRLGPPQAIPTSQRSRLISTTTSSGFVGASAPHHRHSGFAESLRGHMNIVPLRIMLETRQSKVVDCAPISITHSALISIKSISLCISLKVSVSSYADLFWYLGSQRRSVTQNSIEVISPEPTGPVIESASRGRPPPIITVPDQASKTLFALIIGINKYKSEPLRGCKKDAKDVRNYLLQDLKVPDSHIRFLTNKKAKRADILDAFKEIQTDKRIKKNDPILIYFAGHGDETDAPTGWPSGDVNNQIQMIIPQDYCIDPGKEVHGIPDHTLAALLNGIANQHGDNITVIFDCCHSGSGTRGSRNIRGLSERMKQSIPKDLDRDIWSTASGSRGSSTAPEYTRSGLANHVLLAACTQKEKARDAVNGGPFTQAFLPTLKSVGADKLTYASLLERMDKIPFQNPQCEGVNQNRIIFDSRAPTTGRVCFPIKMKDSEYEMQAGSAHGVTEGSEFSLYNDSLAIDDSSSLCVFVVASAADIRPFTTTLTRREPSAAVTPLSPTSCVLQTKAGEPEDLLVFASLDERLIRLYETLATMMQELHPGKRQIRLVKEKEKARLGLSIVDNRIAFDNFDSRLAEYGLTQTRMPHTVANDPKEIIPVLHGAAHFWWHLNREVKNTLVDTHIAIECNILKPTGDHDISGKPILKATGDNLLQPDGVIGVVASEETMYGYKITNESKRDLYINAFYFDNTDFSIQTYYQSPTSGKFETYPTLTQGGGSLTLGYGSGGVNPFTYCLEEGSDIDVGYLVFFISSENVNLSTIPQETPFEGPGRKSVQKKPPAQLIYGTILVPIVQRRYPDQEIAELKSINASDSETKEKDALARTDELAQECAQLRVTVTAQSKRLAHLELQLRLLQEAQEKMASELIGKSHDHTSSSTPSSHSKDGADLASKDEKSTKSTGPDYGAFESKHPLYKNDRFIGRIPTKSFSPPYTVASIKLSLCELEGLSEPDKARLFTPLSSSAPKDDSARLSLEGPSGPGLSEQDPIALVVESEMRTEEAAAQLEKLPERSDNTEINYGKSCGKGDEKAKTSFDKSDISLGRINTLFIAPPHTAGSLKACIAKFEGLRVTQGHALYKDKDILMSDTDVISFQNKTYPGSDEGNPVALATDSKFTKRGQLTSTYIYMVINSKGEKGFVHQAKVKLL